MTRKKYRARYRSYRNVGLICVAVCSLAWGLCVAFDASETWVIVLSFVLAIPEFLGIASLLGYYVTGFSDDR